MDAYMKNYWNWKMLVEIAMFWLMKYRYKLFVPPPPERRKNNLEDK